MKIQAPTTSANGGTYFIAEEKKNKTKNYFERTSVQIVEFYFLFFDKLLTYVDFEVYFSMKLIKLQNSPRICEFSSDDKGQLCTPPTNI